MASRFRLNVPVGVAQLIAGAAEPPPHAQQASLAGVPSTLLSCISLQAAVRHVCPCVFSQSRGSSWHAAGTQQSSTCARTNLQSSRASLTCDHR
jgi:hypothetical protein